MGSGSVVKITDRAEHDAAVAKSETEPTVIFVCNSSTPVCKAFTPKYEDIAARHADSRVRFYLMEFNNSTSMMFKFAPNQLPVVVFMCRGTWCRTIMGANVKELEDGVRRLVAASEEA